MAAGVPRIAKWRTSMPRLVPSGLPFALLGFAAGVLTLQAQPELPAPGGWLALAAAAFGWAWLARACANARWTFAAALAVGVAAAGFGYAAMRAHDRLADELPPKWEGVDMTIFRSRVRAARGSRSRSNASKRRRRSCRAAYPWSGIRRCVAIPRPKCRR